MDSRRLARPIRRLQWSYLIALGLIAVLTTAAHLMITHGLAKDQPDAKLINMAGRQRMLSEQMAKAAVGLSLTEPGSAEHRVWFDSLNHTFHRWSTNQDALQFGDASRGLTASTDMQLQLLYQNVSPTVIAIREAMQHIRDHDAEVQFAVKLIEQQKQYLPFQDEIVNRHEVVAQARVDSFYETMSWLLVVTLILLVLEALIVFEPTVRAMRKLVDSLLASSTLMSYQARHDELTGLPNRSALLERLDELCDPNNENHHAFTLLFIDFDRFKIINDSLGHDVGDQLLRNIAKRIGQLAEQTRSYQVEGYRLGGDEFVILGLGHAEESLAKDFAQTALDLFAPPHQLGPHRCVSTASIGVVVGESAGPGPSGVKANLQTPTDLLRHADLAMFQAKEAGKGRYIFFDGSMFQYVHRRMEIDQQLHAAMQNGLLELHYQPIVQANSNKIHRVEALYRWSHPSFGVIDNDEIIDVAEESGLIHELSDWAFRQVANDIAYFDRKPGLHGVTIAMNISRSEALAPTFVDRVNWLLEDEPRLRGRLCLEFSENVIGRSREAFARILSKLSSQDLSCGLDDFGREQSSLSYLATLPIQQLKIDQQVFRADAQVDDRSWMIPRAIIAFAHGLGIEVAVMGLDSRDEVAVALDLTADHLQGKAISRSYRRNELHGALDREGRLRRAA